MALAIPRLLPIPRLLRTPVILRARAIPQMRAILQCLASLMIRAIRAARLSQRIQMVLVRGMNPVFPVGSLIRTMEPVREAEILKSKHAFLTFPTIPIKTTTPTRHLLCRGTRGTVPGRHAEPVSVLPERNDSNGKSETFAPIIIQIESLTKLIFHFHNNLDFGKQIGYARNGVSQNKGDPGCRL